MLFTLSNLNSNLALTLGYLNSALNNSALGTRLFAPLVIFALDTSCDSIRPIKTFLGVNRDGALENLLNFLEEFSNF